MKSPSGTKYINIWCFPLGPMVDTETKMHNFSLISFVKIGSVAWDGILWCVDKWINSVVLPLWHNHWFWMWESFDRHCVHWWSYRVTASLLTSVSL